MYSSIPQHTPVYYNILHYTTAYSSMLQCTPVYCSFCLTIACSELPILYIHLQLFLSYSNLLSIGLSLDQLGISCPCQHASCMFYLSTSAWLHFALFSIYSNVRQESCAFRLEKTLSMGSLLMERIFQSIPNRVLMVHTEWLPSVRLRHFSPTCAVLHNYRGLWGLVVVRLS